MKWPRKIFFVRHAESAYNALKKKKEKSLLYRTFRAAFKKSPDSRETARLAKEVKANLTLEKGDNATPLTWMGKKQALKTGQTMRYFSRDGQNGIITPDTIFVSPHLRTRETLQQITRGWPELSDVKTIEEINIREQEHGLALLCNDWRVFCALHPEQRRLRELEGDYWYRYPQGENVPDVQARIKLWLDTIIRTCAGENIFVVTHHLTILATISLLERSGAIEFLRMDKEEKPINCGVTLYEFNIENRKLERVFYNEKYW